MLRLQLPCFGHLIQTADSLEKSLMLGKIEDRQKEKRALRMRWLNGIIDEMNMNLGKLWDMVRNKETWCAAVQGVAKNWT